MTTMTEDEVKEMFKELKELKEQVKELKENEIKNGIPDDHGPGDAKRQKQIDTEKELNDLKLFVKNLTKQHEKDMDEMLNSENTKSSKQKVPEAETSSQKQQQTDCDQDPRKHAQNDSAGDKKKQFKRVERTD